jgi:quercetin dioxygenase-like cupin family protein
MLGQTNKDLTEEKITLVNAGVNLQAVKMPGAENCKMQELLTAAQKAPNFSMRFFEVEPLGHTPFHSHPWEHEIYVLKGQGSLKTDGEDIPFGESQAILVPPNTKHQFFNSGKEPLQFICLIPNNVSYQTEN